MSASQQPSIGAADQSRRPSAQQQPSQQPKTLLRAPLSVLRNLQTQRVQKILLQQPSHQEHVKLDEQSECNQQIQQAFSGRERFDSTASVSHISFIDHIGHQHHHRDPPMPDLHDPHPQLQMGSHQARESSHQSDIQEGQQSENDSDDEEGDLCGHLHQLERAESEMIMHQHSRKNVGQFPPRVRSMEQQIPAQSMSSQKSRMQAVCVNCEGRFRQSKMHQNGRLCANCNKIYQSVATSVSGFQGSFKMIVRRPGKVELVLSCSKHHSWVIGMQSKKAKNGCRQCKDLIRAENARRQFEEQARLEQEQEQRQRLLLEQHAQAFAQELGQNHSRLHDLLMVRVLQSEGGLSPQLHMELADLFLENEEQALVDFLSALEESSFRQLVNRLRLALHPDKNTFHPRAGEAFSKMTQLITQITRFRDKSKSNSCCLIWRCFITSVSVVQSLARDVTSGKAQLPKFLLQAI